MAVSEDFAEISPTTIADVVGRDRVMDLGIRPLFAGTGRIAGSAFPVRCPPGDNLMVHAAIYRAEPGQIVVVEAGDLDYAVAGGNVCAVAQRRGIAGFVVDGVIRDLGESRARRFPLFARGVIPKPGDKDAVGRFGIPVRCGGVEVSAGDIVVADEEGVVVVPAADAARVRDEARELARKDAATSLEDWERAHYARTEQLLRDRGFTD